MVNNSVLNSPGSIGWSEDVIHSKLIAMGNLEGKKVAWIGSDLKLTKSNWFSRLVWTVFAKHFSWMRKYFYGVDLEKSRSNLEKIGHQLKNNQDLLSLFKQAVSTFNKIAPHHKVSIAETSHQVARRKVVISDRKPIPSGLDPSSEVEKLAFIGTKHEENIFGIAAHLLSQEFLKVVFSSSEERNGISDRIKDSLEYAFYSYLSSQSAYYAPLDSKVKVNLSDYYFSDFIIDVFAYTKYQEKSCILANKCKWNVVLHFQREKSNPDIFYFEIVDNKKSIQKAFVYTPADQTFYVDGGHQKYKLKQLEMTEEHKLSVFSEIAHVEKLAKEICGRNVDKLITALRNLRDYLVVKGATLDIYKIWEEHLDGIGKILNGHEAEELDILVDDLYDWLSNKFLPQLKKPVIVKLSAESQSQ